MAGADERVAMYSTSASSIYTSTYDQMQSEFHCSKEVLDVGLSLFVLGISLGPMFLGPLSEFYGRRPIYLVTWTLYLIWIIPEAVATNIQTVLVGRFFDGFCGSAFLAVSGGTVSDLFARHELQLPMAVFSVAPFIGPSMGPLIGGFINSRVNWRWTYYVLLIWSFAILAALAALVPETFRTLEAQAITIRRRTNPPARPLSFFPLHSPLTVSCEVKALH